MNTEGFDPHLDLAEFAGALTHEEVEEYKNHNETKVTKDTRSMYKSVNYAATYGVGDATMSRTAKCSKEEAHGLLEAYWEKNWSIRAVAEAQIVKTISDGSKWLYNPLSKLWYSLRSDKDRFSTLNQGTGVFCFDMWIMKVRSVRKELTGQFHDEIILTVKIGHREECKKLLKWAINEVNKDLKMNRELDVDIKFGSHYNEIH